MKKTNVTFGGPSMELSTPVDGPEQILKDRK